MRPKTPCLDPETLALFASGKFAQSLDPAAEVHLAECPVCRGAAAALADEPAGADEDSLPQGLNPPDPSAAARAAVGAYAQAASAPLRLRPARVAAAAAALLLAVGGGYLLFREGDRAAAPRALPAGRAVTDARVALPARAEADLVECADGTRLRLAPFTDAAIRQGEGAERLVVEMTRGAIEADVVKGGGQVRIRAPAGEVRVLGTAFTVKVFQITIPSPFGGEGEGGGGSVLAVEVSRGVVELASETGKVRLPAGFRGIVRTGLAPASQEIAPLSWREALARWGKGHEAQGFAASWDCLVLLATSWEGLSDWRQVLEDGSASPAERRAAATLAGLTLAERDAPWALAALEKEMDPDVRRVLAPHAARVAGAEAVERALGATEE